MWYYINMAEVDPGSAERKDRLQTVKIEAASYLKSAPSSDPENIVSVVNFCRRGSSLLLDTIATSWAIYNHQPEDVIRPVLIKAMDDETAYTEGRDSQEQFWLNWREIDIATPPGFKGGGVRDRVTFRGLIASAAYIDRGLPRFSYAWALSEPPRLSKNFRTQGPPKGTFFHYNFRLAEFHRAGEFDLDAGESDLLILIFLEQIAKGQATDAIKIKLRPFGNPNNSLIIQPPSGPVEIQKYFLKGLRETNYHLGYLAKVKEIQAHTIDVLGLDKKHVQIFYDIAFLRKGDLDEGELTQFIEPIMQAVGQGRYQDAFQMRDFLLNNFPGCFPNWRQAEYPEETALAGIKDYLLYKKDKGKPPLENVPEAYREIIQAVLDELTLKEKTRELKEEERKKILESTYRGFRERKEEENRKKILGPKLLLYSLEVASRKLDEQRGIKPRFNPNLPINASNPLYLNLAGNRSNLSSRSSINREGVEVEFRDCVIDENGMVLGFNTYDTSSRPNYRIYYYDDADYHLTSVFNNLLYRDLISPEIVREAYDRLKQEGQIVDSESVHDLLTRALSFSVAALKGHVNFSGYDEDSLAFTQMKVSKATDLLEAVKQS